MEIKSIIPLHVIQASLGYNEPEILEVSVSGSDFEAQIQNASVGLLITFPSTQSYVKLAYKNGFQEYREVSRIKVGVADSDGWMNKFDEESVLVIQAQQEPKVESQVFPETFIEVY